MTLTELRYAIALAETKNFRQASSMCNVSQPTLSIAIKKMEAELGVQIFERTTNTTLLTQTGEKIITQAHTVLEATTVIKDIALSEKNKLIAPLHIGAIFTISAFLFPNFVSPLQKSAPDMPLIFEEGYTEELRSRLRKGELDLIIVALPFEEPDVVVQSLYDEPFVVALPSNHPLAQHSSLKAEELAKEHILLLGQGHSFRDQVIKAIPNINQYHNTIVMFNEDSAANSLETLCTMVSTGFGISIFPQSVTKTPNFIDTDLVAVPLHGENAKRRVVLAWRASFPRHQAIDAVRNAIFISHNISPNSRAIPELAYD